MQRFTDLVISIAGATVSFGLSWPFWRDFEYWATSKTMWNIYFVVGFILGVYVFYVTIGSLRFLFTHAADEVAAAAAHDAASQEGGPQS